MGPGDLGLTPAEFREYELALAKSHMMRVRFDLRDRNEKRLGEQLTGETVTVLEGSVAVDAFADVTRKLDLKLFDPDGEVKLEPDGSGVAIWPNRFVSVTRGVYVPGLSRWVDVPVFWGPITKFQRAGPQVSIEGLGKEMLLQSPYSAFRSRKFEKGTHRRRVIRNVIRGQGERQFRGFGRLNRGPKLPKDRVLRRFADPWVFASNLARSMGHQLYYDGKGQLTFRRFLGLNDTQYIFRDGEDGVVLSQPILTTDFTHFRNVVFARGGTPKGKKKRVAHTAHPNRGHPLSRQSLARNGEQRVAVEVIENSQWNRKPEVRREAQRELADKLRLEMELSFNSLTVAHLEERDAVRVQTTIDGYEVNERFYLASYTIPLTSGTPMSVGTNVRVIGKRKRDTG